MCVQLQYTIDAIYIYLFVTYRKTLKFLIPPVIQQSFDYNVDNGGNLLE